MGDGMKIKVSELDGPMLDYAVAIAKGFRSQDLKLPRYKGDALFRYGRDEDGNLDGTYITGPDLIFSRKYEAGGPIIDSEGIDLYCNVPTNPKHKDPAWRGSWRAKYHRAGVGSEMYYGPTMLIAAMRCYVGHKLGNEVEIPDALVKVMQ